MRIFRVSRVATMLVAALMWPATAGADSATIRVATYNASLFRESAGQLARDLTGGDNEQARRIAEVIQRVRPDILLVNEFDYDPDGRAARLFLTKYLVAGQEETGPIEYPHYFTAPVNTGVPTSRDLDKDGRLGGAADAIGYGQHEGQYGMLLLSRFPIDRERVRTFQKFLWRDMPDAMLPVDPQSGLAFYDDDDLRVLRLSSKSVWDVPVGVPARGQSGAVVLHLVCSHPTPPVFDGPEDRNGCRNYDEIRLLADFLSGRKAEYLVDDAGNRGGLAGEALFVVLGDLNCDPVDGQGVRGAIGQLLKHSRIDASFTPTSEGGLRVVKQFADQHEAHRGVPAHVTADFTGEGHGCLRIDYALPSHGLTVVDGGVYWPVAGEPGATSIGASDHRLVWIDIRPHER